MNEDGNGQLPVWQPGDEVPAWAAKLAEPFPPDEVGLRPQVWCPKCREQKGVKYCGMKADERGSGGVEHVRKKCKDCGQNITQAHLHLSYIGHAHITDRLIAADPKWTWRPMGRDIPPEVMTAAIATGNLSIVQTVINAYPPKIIEVDGGNGRVEHIMWGEVIIHDENGDEFAMPGVGDAIGKAWDPNAVKEMVGDLLRNALMRHGAGLDLWKKEDADKAKRERTAAGADDPGGYAARASIFDQDQAAEGTQARSARGRAAARKPAEPPPDTGNAGINPEAQAAADLAYKIAASGSALQQPDLGKLQDAHAKARTKMLLGLHCLNPVNQAEKTTVLKAFAFARQQIEDRPTSAES